MYFVQKFCFESESCTNTCEMFSKYFKIIMKTILFLLIISFIHWFIIAVYNFWCYDSSYGGIFINIFKIGSPICITLNKIQLAISEHFITFVLGCGLAFAGFIKNFVD